MILNLRERNIIVEISIGSLIYYLLVLFFWLPKISKIEQDKYVVMTVKEKETVRIN